MSVKYERIKQSDMALPAPLRWLTRAFSSITLAVIFLLLIALFGLVASVPMGYLAKLFVGLLCALFGPGLFGVLAYKVLTGKFLADSFPTRPARWFVALTALALGIVGGSIVGWQAISLIHHSDWYRINQAQVVYRLPFFEMTELELYAWWPMKVLLGLFVINMVWATIRRIEFKFVNIGVLTVHTGIVLIALGSIFYGANKLEGDTILWRQDVRPGLSNRFYDATRPAVYFLTPTQRVMADLPDLPRYNDYELGSGKLSIPLHEAPGFLEAMGPDVKAWINGFIAYGQLEPKWIDLADTGETLPDSTSPAIMITPGPGPKITTGPDGKDRETFTIPDNSSGLVLVAGVPAKRVIEQPGWAVEFLYQPIPQYEKDWNESFDGEHGLVIEIPSKNFYKVYSVKEGDEIKVGDTGYTIKVEAIGDYGLPFITPGYQGATDNRAQVTISDGTKTYRRIAMHRFPERTQDFIPAPEDPTVGPMGRRVPPNPEIRVQYLDATKPQFRLIAHKPDLSDLVLNVRLPDHKPFQGAPPRMSFPLPKIDGQEIWLHVVKKLQHAVDASVPVTTPKAQRLPKEEGTMLHALVPVTFEYPDKETRKPIQKTVWLAHMRYPEPDMAGGMNKPEWLEVPGVGRVGVIFSRRAYPLPFSMKLNTFEMHPYPGSDIPRDYHSNITFTPINLKGEPIDEPFIGDTRLNNPYIARTPFADFQAAYKSFGFLPTVIQFMRFGTLKISQTGWDPGDRTSPAHKAKNEAGLYINQQRYSIVGVSNNVAIRVIFIGAVLIALGIPWAFYIKPLLLRRERDKIKAELAKKVAAAGGLDKPRP